MTTNPLMNIPRQAPWGEEDTLLLIGELFGRGYANGIVEEARRRGMTIIGTTVGRRDADGTLRPLNDGELSEAEALLGGRIINIPLEAGFDMEPSLDGKTPCDLLRSAKPDQWAESFFPPGFLEASRDAAERRLRDNMERVVAEAVRSIHSGRRVLVVHAMAGGVPRARLFMPLLNRIFKGRGEKHLPSGAFWQSDLGTFCSLNFDEVTANTFRHLIQISAPLREGREVRYAAYGYHGTRVMISGEYLWQSYTPYLQGWAKMLLERHAADARREGIHATVFNAPEIQTNSSALFLGVEISLYPFIRSVRAEAPRIPSDVEQRCTALLREENSLDTLLNEAEQYLSSPLHAPFRDPARWPLHSTREVMELMLETSDRLMALSANPKEPLCGLLSQLVFTGVGRLMMDHSWWSQDPVVWLDHDIVARSLDQNG